MWRLIAGIALVLISCVFGGLLCSNITGESSTVSDMGEDLRTIRSLIKYERKSMREILERLCECGKLRRLWCEIEKLFEQSGNMSGAWLTASKTFTLHNDEYRQELDSFFSGFGTGGIEAELSRLEKIICSTERMEEKIKNELDGKLKLIRTLTTLGGIALALIIL